jgi:large subunit ribosomal protein L1
MDKNSVLKTLEQLKKEASQRKFKQSIDLIIALKDLDFKKTEQQVEFFASIPNSTGKKIKICALIGPELRDDASKVFDLVILQDDFSKYDKAKAKKLAKQFDFFVAQANIMNKVAGAFGRYLGVRGKMPNPKAGCVVPPKGANLKALYDKLQKTVKISARKIPVVQLRVGTEEMPAEQVADNVLFIYDQLIHHLPMERQNVRNAYLKLTMSKPVSLEK